MLFVVVWLYDVVSHVSSGYRINFGASLNASIGRTGNSGRR